MYDELGAAFERVRTDDTLGVAVLTGSGYRAFGVGADLTESIPALAQGRFDISRLDGAHRRHPAGQTRGLRRQRARPGWPASRSCCRLDLQIAAEARTVRAAGERRGGRAAGGWHLDPADPADPVRLGDGADAARRPDRLRHGPAAGVGQPCGAKPIASRTRRSASPSG